VAEKFNYLIREDETKEVIDAFVYRKEMRRNAGDEFAQDKCNNPLTALPGSPGIGKSTFLTHFPLSKNYLSFAGSLSIVSTLTFNSNMDAMRDEFKIDNLGLRIFYGSLKAMGVIHHVSWYDFLIKYTDAKKFETLTVYDSIEFLQIFFGKERKIYIGVDEIQKAKNPKEVMNQLGSILNTFEFVDILVTAISPEVISKLTTKSRQRNVIYCPLKPLLFYNLGFYFSFFNFCFFSTVSKKNVNRYVI
jgi:hypothetical protein